MINEKIFDIMREISRDEHIDVRIYCLECPYEAIIADGGITEYFSNGDNIFCPECGNKSIIATDGEKLFKKDKFVEDI